MNPDVIINLIDKFLSDQLTALEFKKSFSDLFDFEVIEGHKDFQYLSKVRNLLE